MTGERVFVPDGENRKDTLILLLGTAQEMGLDPRTVRSTKGGFMIAPELAANEELAGVLYDGDDSKPAKKAATKKTSGNRAAKTDSKKKE